MLGLRSIHQAGDGHQGEQPMNLYDYHELVNARRSDDMHAFHAAELAGLTRRRSDNVGDDGRSWLHLFHVHTDPRANRRATGRRSSAVR